MLLLQDRGKLASVRQQLQRRCRSTQVDGVASAVANAVIQRHDPDIDSLLAQTVRQRAFLSQNHQRIHLITNMGQNVEQGDFPAAPSSRVIDIRHSQH
ncbi:hypothetical protein D3C72_2194450 [compost metagenome]